MELSPGMPAGSAVCESSLASLASKAAVELDNRARGKQTTLTALTKLTCVLDDKLLDTDQVQPARALMDPITAEIFGRAFGLTELPDSKPIKELKDSARSMASRLSHVDENSETDELRQLRDFCVALAQSAQADLQQRRESRPKGRFRK